MQEREIKVEEIQVGDTIRLEDDCFGVKYTAQGVVRRFGNQEVYLGEGVYYLLCSNNVRQHKRKVILVSRPPKETPIKPEDIRLGMWVRINGAEAERVIGAALYKDHKGVEHTEIHLSKCGWRLGATIVDISKIQTAVVVDAPTA